MKKFSNISGSKVSEEPKIEPSKEVNELNQIKYSIMTLMNDLLRVQSYGSARKNILATTKITGQELFVEALLDLINGESFKGQIKVLESLKSTNRDWNSIDNRINLLSEQINQIKDIEINRNHISKIKSLIDVYGGDPESFEFMVERYCSKIHNRNTAYQRAVTAKIMMEDERFKKYPSEQLLVISEKFLSKAKDLTKS